MQLLLTWSATGFGLIAAGLWYWASTLRVRFDPDERDEFGLFPAVTVHIDKAGFETDVDKTLRRQSQVNAWAAMSAAAAALSQAIAQAPI